MAKLPGAGEFMILTRRRSLMLGLTGLSLAAVNRYGISGAYAAEPLRIGDQKGGARSLLKAAGIGDNASSPLQWSLFAGAPMLIQALTAKAIDAGVIGDAPLVFAQSGSDEITAIAGVQTDGTTTAVVVPPDSAIRSVADLKGKRIATLKGQTGHYLVLAALKAAGLHAKDVRFVFIPPVAAKLALQTGAVDAWATWGPYISDAKVSNGAREIVNGGQLMSGLSYVVATREALEKNRAGLVNYVQQLKAGHQWMQTHTDDYAKVWAEEVGLSLPVAKDVVRTMRGTIIPLTPDIVVKQQQVSDFMTETGMISGKLNAQAVMDGSFTF
ncbi:MAG: ABC transporter substrate-binding protein [Gluconobacter japonicus]|nr:ABC transporter substrate-binding protein [Gluconobacter japonicus]